VSLVRDRAPNGSLLGPPPQPQSKKRFFPKNPDRKRKRHGGSYQSSQPTSPATRGCCGWMIVALVAAMFAIMKRKPGGRHLKPLPVPGPPGAIDSKYGDALGIALQSFHVQKCEYRCFTEQCMTGRAGLSFKGCSLRRRGPSEFCLWRRHVRRSGKAGH
jgi:hypothetical protein